MTSTRVRLDTLPRNTALFLDFLNRFDKVAAFYEHRPFQWEEFPRAAAAIDYPVERRRALVEALRAQNGAGASIELLAQPETVVVATGQQVGLFSGPAYTVYKALTAARLAARLREQGIPAVAVFWLATEDHDFDEVNHCWVFGADQAPVRLEAGAEAGGRRPVGSIGVPAPPVAELRAALSELPFAEQVVDWVADSYAPGRTLGEAFQGLLQKVLASQGLLFLDPLRAEIRQMAAPILYQAGKATAELNASLLERGRQLKAAGYHEQVRVEAQKPLFFRLENGRRMAVREGQIEAALEAPEQLSPNALLRPVVADYLMPTVANVVGPAEVAYLAQSQVLHRALLGRSPVIVPRNGFTILDARAARMVKKFALTLGDLLLSGDALSEKLGRALTPRVVSRTLGRSQMNAEEALDRVVEILARFDPTLGSAAEKSRSKILSQFSKLERKVSRETVRRDERASRDAVRLANLVYPRKHLQERFYSILPFLARHGPELIDGLYENVDLDSPDHHLLAV